MRILGLALGGLSPIFFLMSLAVAACDDLIGISIKIAMIMSLGITALVVVIANQHLVRARGIRADLRQGQWLRFEGTYRGAEESETPVAAHRMLAHYLGQPMCLDVLPASARLWRVNDHPVRRWVTVTLTDTADQPEIAEIAAQWLDPIGDHDGLTMAAGQRELSGAEKDELRRHQRTCWRRPLLPTLLLVPWASGVCYLAISTGTMPRGWDGVIFLVLLFLAGQALYRQAQMIRLALQLRNDVRDGIVRIVRATPAEDADTPSDPTLVEMLPHANLPWTVQTQPAEWRHVRVTSPESGGSTQTNL